MHNHKTRAFCFSNICCYMRKNSAILWTVCCHFKHFVTSEFVKLMHKFKTCNNDLRKKCTMVLQRISLNKTSFIILLTKSYSSYRHLHIIHPNRNMVTLIPIHTQYCKIFRYLVISHWTLSWWGTALQPLAEALKWQQKGAFTCYYCQGYRSYNYSLAQPVKYSCHTLGNTEQLIVMDYTSGTRSKELCNKAWTEHKQQQTE
jgi:hypothetical protein